MHLKTLSPLLRVLALAGSVAAFLRTAPDKNPYDYAFPRYAGVPNITECIAYDYTGIKSYWFANFLHGDNGHDYCIVAVNANVYPHVLTSISLMDITAKTFYGETTLSAGKVSNSSLSALVPGVLDIYATSADQFSNLVATSVVPNATFNLSYVAQGPNFYQGATGSYFWGTGLANAFDNPETLPSGTITWEGKKVNVVSAQSKTWFDVQWGPGYATNGWYSFVFLLDNGVRVVTMTTGPEPNGFTNSIVTFGYLDGHHEVYTMDTDVKPSNPWKSAATNITYYNNYDLHIPGKARFHVTLPVEGGELPNFSDLKGNNTPVADSFAYFEGYMDGGYVKGVGIAERKAACLTCL